MDVVHHFHQCFTFRDISIIPSTSLPEMVLRLLATLLLDSFEKFRHLVLGRVWMDDEVNMIRHKNIGPQ